MKYLIDYIFNNVKIRYIMTILSLVGAFTVSNINNYIKLFGYSIWMITNIYWCIDAYRRNDKQQFIMWFVYCLSVILGLYYSIIML
jgi:hypothetical protein